MPIEQNEETIRIRVKDSDLFVKDSFATITLSEDQGIKAVIGKLKSDPDGPTHVQVYLFDKDKWTMAEAEKWVEEHKKRSGMEKRTNELSSLRMIYEKDSPPTLEGIAITYNTPSDNEIYFDPNIREVIMPGAFKKSIESGKNIFCLAHHDITQVLGRTSKGTLKLNDEETGLKFQCIPPNTTWANDLITSVKRGDISSMSFSFTIDSERWEKNTRYVNEGRLFEISVVTHPVYESTSVVARGAGFMMIDGMVLDYVSPEKIVEREKTKTESFKNMMDRFEAIKKELT